MSARKSQPLHTVPRVCTLKNDDLSVILTETSWLRVLFWEKKVTEACRYARVDIQAFVKKRVSSTRNGGADARTLDCWHKGHGFDSRRPHKLQLGFEPLDVLSQREDIPKADFSQQQEKRALYKTEHLHVNTNRRECVLSNVHSSWSWSFVSLTVSGNHAYALRMQWLHCRMRSSKPEHQLLVYPQVL